MEWDIKTIGLLAAIFFIGYFIGLIEAAIKQKRKVKKESSTKLPSDVQSIENEKSSLLRLRRDASQSLIVEVNGASYRKEEDLTPENRQSLIKLLIELRPWMDRQASQPTKSAGSGVSKTTSSQSKPSKESNPDDEQTEETANVGMVSQIDEILQTRIASSPYANTGVRLIESPTGGVLVYVGLEKFEGIASVPDPQIKALIHEAVREWEEKS